MDLKIHIDYAKPWWQGYIEFNGEKHYPMQSKHLEKFLYNCARVMIGPLKDKIMAILAPIIAKANTPK